MPNSIERSVENAQNYIAPEGLKEALAGAIALGQPLLLTGEPGTGKTTVADWVAWQLNQTEGGYHPEPLRFFTKTTSHATDLFYTYDALSHFQAVNLRDGVVRNPAEFIELQALGRAIAMTDPKPEYLEKCRVDLPDEACHVVVLIDEVDKAPRDFTNDILDEILNYRFRIREQGNYPIEKADDRRIVVVLTSNSEKGLPEAFLRRCAFFHIEFPKREGLREIVKKHLGYVSPATESALDFFEAVRAKKLRKQPATAELLGWLELMGMTQFAGDWKAPENRKPLLDNLAFLVKTQEDLEVVKKMIPNTANN